MLPNFLVIGATRSGTTSLHHYLGQHPDIYVSPVKEPNFFVFDGPLPRSDDLDSSRIRRAASQWIRDRRTYEDLFAGTRGERAVGEVSPLYMQTESAPGFIHRVVPDARLIAVLRHPVDRSYGQFMGRRRDGVEGRTDFEAIIREELKHPRKPPLAGHVYLQPSRYHDYLKPYYDRFPARRIHVGLFDDFRRDPRRFLAAIFGFLGVDPTFVPDTSEHHNRTGIIQNSILRFLWTRSRRTRSALRPYLPGVVRHAAFPLLASNLARPPLDAALRAELTEVFRDEIEKLQKLIGRNLDCWLR